jgi:multicomponent K+:H+ antiporter subunit E
LKTAAASWRGRLPPLLIGGLVVMWLLLSQSRSLAQVVLGGVLAVALAFASSVLRPLPRLRRLHLAAALAAIVLGDIVRSNVGVARIVLGLTGGRRVTSGFVDIPLTLRDPHGLAVLAAIVTSTPGTVWVDLDATTQTLTLHVLDLKSEQEWIDWIKNRYERVLLRIYE